MYVSVSKTIWGNAMKKFAKTILFIIAFICILLIVYFASSSFEIASTVVKIIKTVFITIVAVAAFCLLVEYGPPAD